MHWNNENLLKLFNSENRKIFLEGKWGIEKEGLRILTDGKLALTPHPAVFGNKLSNNQITTDFSESQVEIITPPEDSLEETYTSLLKLVETVNKNIDDEIIWSFSMPPVLPDEADIPLAKFDDNKDGKEKEIYREGLSSRYGKKMQMISGIHFNFSFGEKLVDLLHNNFGNINKKEFKNKLYFIFARNYLRYRWLLIYLFGASPVIDDSYESVVCKEMDNIRKCCPGICKRIKDFKKNSISLRVSRFGYSVRSNKKFLVMYDNLSEYISKIRKQISTKNKKYRKIGVFKNGKQIQLNDNFLQKENEFYSSIRLKQNVKKGESQIDSLEKNGVKYAEIRIMDIDPFCKTGINLDTMYFLHVFILFCLFESDNKISSNEMKILNENHHITALLGRKNGIYLEKPGFGKIKFDDWADEIFIKLEKIASYMVGNENGKYIKAVLNEKKKLFNKKLLPSEKIVSEMTDKNEDFIQIGLRYSIKNSAVKSSIKT